MLGLEHLGLERVADVRIGKHIRLNLEAENQQLAAEKVEQACKKLLANLIMESYSFELNPAE
jgi:phosphoribosylformylglycinamidine synthase